MENSQKDLNSRFVEQLTGSQRHFYAYINTLLGGDPAVVDVLQDTNVDLWSKADEFDPDRPFLPWAYRFAYFRVMAHRKTLSRSRLVFDDACVQRLAQQYERTDVDLDGRLAALNDCLEKLTANHKELIQQRYVQKTFLSNPKNSYFSVQIDDAEKPFFTCLWFSEPHTPVLAAGEFRALYPKEAIKSHVEQLATSGGSQVKRRAKLQNPDLYFGCVSMLDHHIGRLMDYLDAKGLAENTIVVFTSDNGPEHRTATAFGSSGHLRGAKGHMHDGGIHVPGIIRWPGKIEPASVSEEPVNGTDWLPTLCAVAGVETPTARPLDGANVLPALLHGKPVVRERPMMWWLWHARGGYEVAMRDGDYKLLATMLPQADPGAIADARQPKDWTIMQFIKQAELARFEMFNLAEDPSETTDLAAAEPERFDSLKRRMIDLHAEIRAEGPEYQLGKTKKK